MAKEHPEKDKEVQFDDKSQFVTDLKSAVEEAEEDREKWANRQSRWYKKRFGIRPKKTFPWAGCSNLHLPLTDKTIRKLKPFFVMLVLGFYPICRFDPVGGEDIESTTTHEIFFDWLLRVTMKIFKPIVFLVDKMLEQGFAVVKIIWDYKTEAYTETIDIDEFPEPIPTLINDPLITDEMLMNLLASHFSLDLSDEDDFERCFKAVDKFRQGKKIEIELEKTVYDAPKLLIRSAKDIVVPDDTTDVQKASWVCDKAIYVTPNELRIAAKDKKYSAVVVEEIIERHKAKEKKEKGKTATTLESTIENREGIYQYEDTELINLWEICCYYDLNKDGIGEKCVVTFDPDYPEEDLRFISFPYDHGLWPYVRPAFELTSERHYSPRGIPEILDPLQTALTVQHNQKIDRQTMTNTVTLKYLPGIITPQNVKFIPGQGIPVPRMDAIEELNISNKDFSFDKEEQILKSWAEEYIGLGDFGISSKLSPTSPRTKYEMQRVEASKGQTAGLDAMTFQNSMAEIYYQIWALWWQYGEEKTWVRVTNEPKPIAVTKEDIQGRFDIIPNGRFDNTNPVLEAQKALARLQWFTGDPYINQRELRVDFIQRDNPQLVKKLLLPEQQAQQNIAKQQAEESVAQKQVAGQKQMSAQKVTQQGGAGGY